MFALPNTKSDLSISLIMSQNLPSGSRQRLITFKSGAGTGSSVTTGTFPSP